MQSTDDDPLTLADIAWCPNHRQNRADVDWTFANLDLLQRAIDRHGPPGIQAEHEIHVHWEHGTLNPPITADDPSSAIEPLCCSVAAADREITLRKAADELQRVRGPDLPPISD